MDNALSIQSNIREWLEPGEELLEFTLGSEQGQVFQTIIALTSMALRLGSPMGSSTHLLPTIENVEWSPLWARLNISISDPKQKRVFAVNGKEWKSGSLRLADTWNALRRSG